MVLATLLLVAYLGAFLWLLLDCLAQKELPPLLGSPRASKAAWACSFFLVNPLLVPTYLVLVRKRWLRPPVPVRDLVVVLTLLAGLWMQ